MAEGGFQIWSGYLLAVPSSFQGQLRFVAQVQEFLHTGQLFSFEVRGDIVAAYVGDSVWEFFPTVICWARLGWAAFKFWAAFRQAAFSCLAWRKNFVLAVHGLPPVFLM